MHRIYGIRHHGPGSARSLAAALAATPPDALVIEAPEELLPLLPWLDNPDLQPPVAAMFWAAAAPKQATFYPFATYSPEWVALRWARAQDVPIYPMDLPMRYRLAAEPASAAPTTSAAQAAAIDPTADPIEVLARAAGYDDGEAWWEHWVETRDDDAFDAITEAMAAAREAGIGRHDEDTLRREAWMRQTLRAALKAGHQQIAVVCGAYHAPVLTAEALKRHSVSGDAQRTRGLAKTKIDGTWVPWTRARLAYASGYGAGVEAPGWYEHLWQSSSADVATGWLAKTAQALRAEDLDAPAASVIEAVRLAQTLATLRQRTTPDLRELQEASLAVLCHGETAILKLAERRLLGRSSHFDVLGTVPDELPQSPLQVDFASRNRSLRLKPEALEKVLDLDLRSDYDRERSQHFWRLHLIGIAWATVIDGQRGRGNFRESWRLRWQPEATLALIEAGRYGGTLESAAAAIAAERLNTSQTLPSLLQLADTVLKAALETALPPVLQALDSRAALAQDIAELLAALSPLVALLRYGDVRGTDLAGLRQLFDRVLTRACIALPGACAQLNPDAAAALVTEIEATHSSLQILDDAEATAQWFAALATLDGAQTTPPLILGRAARLRLDAEQIGTDDASQRLHAALSRAATPIDAAGWLEGFVRGSVHLLLGNAALRTLIGDWLNGLDDSDFQETLPLVRRALSVYTPAERRLLLQEILRGDDAASAEQATHYDPDAYETLRAALRGWLGP